MQWRNSLRFLALTLLVLLAGCKSRSISDSGYRSGDRGSFRYQGELGELDILGIATPTDTSDEGIAKALKNARPPSLKRGDKIILIQSGAHVPDAEMVQELNLYFDAAPFSGMPHEKKTNFAESIRLRAAQGGYPYVFCYWGVLESARHDVEGKTVSWIPLVGNFVPDERQQMRIRLKGILVDVASGSWRMFTPEVYGDEALSSSLSRKSSDQRQVTLLKQRGYRAMTTALLK
jgi:hypothetical protein